MPLFYKLLMLVKQFKCLSEFINFGFRTNTLSGDSLFNNEEIKYLEEIGR